jgi:hypothetical protein
MYDEKMALASVSAALMKAASRDLTTAEKGGADSRHYANRAKVLRDAVQEILAHLEVAGTLARLATVYGKKFEQARNAVDVAAFATFKAQEVAMGTIEGYTLVVAALDEAAKQVAK